MPQHNNFLKFIDQPIIKKYINFEDLRGHRLYMIYLSSL